MSATVLLLLLLLLAHGALAATHAHAHVLAPPPSRPVCGNGRLEAYEGCDDGNRLSGDGCRSNCTVEGGWRCPSPRRAG